ncbi:MAG: outer spore coat protein CotE [Bacilli bacterium]
MAYKEIVTKAVIGKGKKKYHNTYQISTEQTPTTILGCWIINHNFSAHESDGKILINGSFDANIWYSYDNDTKTTVVSKKITYTEEEKLTVENKNIVNKDIIVRSLKQPTCISAKEEGNSINIEIEKELGLEIIGDTKVKISSVDEEETWDSLDSEAEEEIDKVNPNYIDEEIVK